MRIFEDSRFSAALVSAAMALASFFAASLAARFWASTERVEREAAMASTECCQMIIGRTKRKRS
jgi:hypothetical protein